LSAGSSVSPFGIGEIMGLDTSESDFWMGGLKVFKRFVDDLEKIK
jgi:oligoendopeptidase F